MKSRKYERMSQPPKTSEDSTNGQFAFVDALKNGRDCSHSASVPEISERNSELCKAREEVSCPLASPVEERLRFTTFLAELSATFVNVPANHVDTEIKSALQQIVEFLGIDRSGFGEVSADGKQIQITHSFELPGVPPSPRCIVDERMPWYANEIWKGEVVRLSRLPDDLPPEAIPERQYCVHTNLKSQLTIPLKMMGTVVGGIGFASLHRYREWPDELVERLRLVGGIFTNALARKRADEALKLAEEQTRILRDELAHATRQELINYLATSIAHEVNQPLCAIASNAQTALELLDIGDIDEAKCALKDIWSDAQRGSAVIGCIRGMVKKEEPRRSTESLASIIEGLRPLMSQESLTKGVAMQIDLRTQDVHIHCNPVQLQQVLVNLFVNAIEAVCDASVILPAIQIQAWQECQDWVHVSVSDTGSGLSKEDCEKVFAPYFTTKQNGLGMGLSISRSIIAAHGGRLWATPGLEHGTIFQFRIPVSPTRVP